MSPHLKWLPVGMAFIALTSSLTGFATGFGGNSAPSRIPVPARVFEATIVDQTGVQVDVERVSYNGEVFLYGNVGEGQVTVPFERISEIRFEPTGDPTKLVALAKLRDGETVKVTVDDDVPCYGSTSFGNYAIETEKIRKIVFTGDPAGKPRATATETPAGTGGARPF